MKICLPVSRLNGLASELASDFRSAPALMVVDSETLDCVGIDATEGSCHALASQIDAVVYVDGMGRGMFNGLRQRGIRVFASGLVSVAEAVSSMARGALDEVTTVACCGGGHARHGDSEVRQATACGGHGHGAEGVAPGRACCGQH